MLRLDAEHIGEDVVGKRLDADVEIAQRALQRLLGRRLALDIVGGVLPARLAATSSNTVRSCEA